MMNFVINFTFNIYHNVIKVIVVWREKLFLNMLNNFQQNYYILEIGANIMNFKEVIIIK